MLQVVALGQSVCVRTNGCLHPPVSQCPLCVTARVPNTSVTSCPPPAPSVCPSARVVCVMVAQPRACAADAVVVGCRPLSLFSHDWALVHSQGQGRVDVGLGVRLALPRSIASTGRVTLVVCGDNHPRKGARCDFKQDPCGCSKRHWSSARGRVGTRTEQGRNWLWRLNTMPCSTTIKQ